MTRRYRRAHRGGRWNVSFECVAGETVQIDGSHAVAVSQPAAVADMIFRAVKGTG